MSDRRAAGRSGHVDRVAVLVGETVAAWSAEQAGPVYVAELQQALRARASRAQVGAAVHVAAERGLVRWLGHVDGRAAVTVPEVQQ